MILPDCMMPDGANPCRGYHELQAEIERWKAEIERLLEQVADLAFTITAAEYIDKTERLQALLKMTNGGERELSLFLKQEAEIDRLNKQCEGLAQAAMNNGQDLLLKEAEIERHIREKVALTGIVAMTVENSLRLELLAELLAEAIPYIDRSRISHLDTDPVVAAHNARCLNFIDRAKAALERKP